MPRTDAIGSEKTLAGPPEAARVGTIIAKRYEILGFLGKGGMGLVYKAHDMELDEDVAIKLLQPEYTRELSEIERLKREIVTARKITHPNVIRLHDFGLDESDEGFISMEVLPGGSLAELLEKGPLALPRALDIAVGVCEGLAAAHDKGIIHRDMKPENVLFDEDGTPKLVDFGLARASTSQHTVWAITGTPRYMSPEQTDGEKATPRSDVYSTGVLLFYLFCGRLPFLADNILALATQHAEEAPPRPRSLRQSIPPKLEEIILKCLEKDPQKRFPSARALAAELRALRDTGEARDTGDTSPRVNAEDRTAMLPSPPGGGSGGAGRAIGAIDPKSDSRRGVLPGVGASEPTAASGSGDERPTTRSNEGRRIVADEVETAEGPAPRAISERKRAAPAPPPDNERTLIAPPPGPMQATVPAGDRTLIGPTPGPSPLSTQTDTAPAPRARAKTRSTSSKDLQLWIVAGAAAIAVLAVAYLVGTKM
ncbi:MAG TPA: protein kinase [bacterium]|nr:protein kinase [bacterium]